MKNEFLAPSNIKSEEACFKSEINIVDQELNNLELNLPFSDRMDLARDLFDSLYDYNSKLRHQAEKKEMLEHLEATGEDNLKHYFLPDIPGGQGDTKKIREGYDRRATYSKTAQHIFVTVGQGEMWTISKDQNPYLKISMSECSSLIGEAEDKIVVAHISYSAFNQIEAVIDFMTKNGIKKENIFVVASQGAFQSERSKEDYNKRALTNKDYVERGVPLNHIQTFEYEPGDFISDNEKISRNLTQVLVSKEGYLKWSFDLKRVFKAGSFGAKEERIGDYKNEELVRFNPTL